MPLKNVALELTNECPHCGAPPGTNCKIDGQCVARAVDELPKAWGSSCLDFEETTRAFTKRLVEYGGKDYAERMVDRAIAQAYRAPPRAR
jgi:hypothetical protein